MRKLRADDLVPAPQSTQKIRIPTSRTIRALIFLLRIFGYQLNFLLAYRRDVRLRGGGRGRDGARWSESGLTTNDWALDLDTSGGSVLRY